MSINIKNLYHTYQPGTPNESHALNDVSIEFHEGDFIGLIGHTGSGKSTLVQHLNGLLKPTKGNLIIDGVDISDPEVKLKDIRMKVGLVFQYPEHQLFEETVAKDVAFGPMNLGLDESEVEKRVRRSLEMVSLDYEEIKDKSPFELSGGQKRRVAIAGILAMEPKYLILDEPTAGLDPKGRDEILDEVAKLHKELKITIILVSHNMDDVAYYANRLLVMHRGKVAYHGTPKEVFRHHRELEEIGLGVPMVTTLLHQLKEKGLDIDTDIIDLYEAKRAIVAALKKKGEGVHA